MIKIWINPHSEPICHSYNHSPVIIGNGPLDSVDLRLENPFLSETHIKIFEDEKGFTILNCTNDPFITVNGNPFNKIKLSSSDIIQIHDIELKFEGETSASHIIKKSEELAAAIDKKIAQKSTSIAGNHYLHQTDLKHEEIGLVDNGIYDLNKEELEALYNELGNVEGADFNYPTQPEPELEKESKYPGAFEVDWNGDAHLTSFNDSYTEKTPEPPPLIPVAPLIKSPKPINRGGLKEFHLSEYEEQKILLQNIANSKQHHKKRTLKWWFFVLGSILLIAGILSGIVYIKMTNETNIEELQASQGVSDIAMALTHAQIYHLAPHNQNWSDSDFLKANLMSVLAAKYPPATDIDNNRQLTCCSYSVRIYTSSDLSHFILIAQPSPSLLQWLIPKGAILVDSNLMELHKIKDLRILNRLLANAEPLEGANGKEIANIIKNSELIRLSSLAIESTHMEFSPPKALAWVRPGAENLIYNAPRYYKFGQPMMQKSLEISLAATNSQTVGLFKQEISALSNLKNLVLYCSQGKKTALQVRKGLKTFAPNQDFLVGFLTFNTKGLISNSQILREENDIHPLSEQNENIAIIDPILPPNGPEGALNDSNHNAEEELDGNDPLYIQLSSLARQRSRALAPISQKLTALITSYSEKPIPNFPERYQELYDQYWQIVNEQDKKIAEELPVLCHEYSDVPASHMLIFAKATGLDLFLAELSKAQPEKILLPFEKEKFLVEIDQAKDLKELNSRVLTATGLFTLEYVCDPHQLICDQNALRNHTISKLQEFLFSPEKHLNIDQKTDANKELLLNVMKHAWIVDPEERDFFIAEWDRDEEQG